MTKFIEFKKRKILVEKANKNLTSLKNIIIQQKFYYFNKKYFNAAF